MNIKFDQETDIVYLRFSNAEIVESDEEKPGIIIRRQADRFMMKKVRLLE